MPRPIINLIRESFNAGQRLNVASYNTIQDRLDSVSCIQKACFGSVGMHLTVAGEACCIVVALAFQNRKFFSNVVQEISHFPRDLRVTFAKIFKIPWDDERIKNNQMILKSACMILYRLMFTPHSNVLTNG